VPQNGHGSNGVSRWARHHGSRLIVLMGASMGGTAVLVAAADLGNLVAGVIDLSGPAQFGAMDALAAARAGARPGPVRIRHS
jgi:pimeloyl-ACP methyl ester carboxylesterase